MSVRSELNYLGGSRDREARILRTRGYVQQCLKVGTMEPNEAVDTLRSIGCFEDEIHQDLEAYQ